MSARLAVVFATLLLSVPARAATPCPTTDQLCTGDPCVTVATDIGADCTLDFGGRTLVIAGGLRIPDGGSVTIKAGSITVQAGINGRSVHGANLTLEASGNLLQQGLVDVTGSAAAGSITMLVAGDVTLAGKMKATGRGATQVAGGSITVLAGGQIIGPGTFSDDVSAGFLAPAGTAIYRGDAGVNLLGHLILRSSSGGYVEFTSANGPVSIGTDIRTRTTGAGGTILVNAATDATIARGMSCDGGTGGTIVVSGATVTMPPHEGLRARGRRGTGGLVVVIGGVVVAYESLLADGFTSGGTVDVSAEQLTITRGVTANGRTAGGRVSLVARSGDLVVGPIASASGGGGVVEAHSAGNLTARGALRAAPGCIGLSASGVVDVSAAAMDTPITSDCP